MKYSPLSGDAFKLEDAEIDSVREKWYVKIQDNSSDSIRFLRKYIELD